MCNQCISYNCCAEFQVEIQQKFGYLLPTHQRQDQKPLRPWRKQDETKRVKIQS